MAEVDRGPVTEWLFAEGVAQAARKEFAQFRQPGRVIEIGHDENGLELRAGSRVAAGDVLARIDPEDAETNLLRAEADALAARERVRAAAATADQAEIDLNRQQQLNQRNIVSAAQLEAAESAFETAQAQLLETQANVAVAAAEVSAARLALKRTALVAPFDGVIALVNIRVGNDVAGGGPGDLSDRAQEASAAFVLIDDASFEITLHLPPFDADRVLEGQRAVIGSSGTAIADHVRGAVPRTPVVEGHVWSVSPSISLTRRAVTVRIRADGTSDILRDGAFVSVWIVVGEVANAIRAPFDGILQRSDNYFAYVVANDTADRRVIAPGLAGLDMVQVLDGLSAGDTLVIRGQHRLSQDAPVRVVEPQ